MNVLTAHPPVPRHRLIAALTACAGLLAALPAHATTFTIFDNAASFSAATATPVSYTLPVGDGSTLPRPYVYGPLGFGSTQSTTRAHLMHDGVYGVDQTYLAMIGPASAISAATNTQVSDIYAIAFNLGTPNGAATVTLKMNFTEVIGTFTTGGLGTTTFIGITSPVPITQVSFTLDNGHEIDFVNFTTAVPVPEPGSAVLAAAGLLVVGSRLRARTRRA